jgi:hypothetical protein
VSRLPYCCQILRIVHIPLVLVWTQHLWLSIPAMFLVRLAFRLKISLSPCYSSVPNIRLLRQSGVSFKNGGTRTKTQGTKKNPLPTIPESCYLSSCSQHSTQRSPIDSSPVLLLPRGAGMIKPDDEPVFPGAYPIVELGNASHSIPPFISKVCPKRSALSILQLWCQYLDGEAMITRRSHKVMSSLEA